MQLRSLLTPLSEAWALPYGGLTLSSHFPKRRGQVLGYDSLHHNAGTASPSVTLRAGLGISALGCRCAPVVSGEHGHLGPAGLSRAGCSLPASRALVRSWCLPRLGGGCCDVAPHTDGRFLLLPPPLRLTQGFLVLPLPSMCCFSLSI